MFKDEYFFKTLYLVCDVFVRYLQEYTALGTAGGMYHFRDQILSGKPELFFVMNADVCCDFPLTDMLDFHRRTSDTPHHTVMGTEVIKYLKKKSIYIYM